MKSILILNQSKTNKSPSLFLDALIEIHKEDYKFFRYYLSENNKLKMLMQLIIPNFRKNLIKFYRKNNCGVIFSTGLICDLLVLVYVKGIKKICFIRGHLPTVYGYKYPIFKIGYLLGIIHYFIASRFDKVIVMTSSMKEEYEQITGKKASILYNYAMPVIKDLEKLQSIKNLKSNKETINFGVVGNLIPSKGVEDAIEAFSEIAKKQKNIRLCFYGSGSHKSYLEKLACEKIPSNQFRFYGYVKNKVEIFQNISILIHPSFSEGTSRAVLEALSAHVIVIHRRIKGADELINEDFNGYLFDDIKSLSKYIYISIKLLKQKQISTNDIEYLLPYEYSLQNFRQSFLKLSKDFNL